MLRYKIGFKILAGKVRVERSIILDSSLHDSPERTVWTNDVVLVSHDLYEEAFIGSESIPHEISLEEMEEFIDQYAKLPTDQYAVFKDRTGNYKVVEEL